MLCTNKTITSVKLHDYKDWKDKIINNTFVLLKLLQIRGA
jgi:hypothetical protein